MRLRWLAMASWAPILLASDLPLGWRPAWVAYAVAVAYVATTHALNRAGRAVRATASWMRDWYSLTLLSNSRRIRVPAFIDPIPNGVFGVSRNEGN